MQFESDYAKEVSMRLVLLSKGIPVSEKLQKPLFISLPMPRKLSKILNELFAVVSRGRKLSRRLHHEEDKLAIRRRRQQHKQLVCTVENRLPHAESQASQRKNTMFVSGYYLV